MWPGQYIDGAEVKVTGVEEVKELTGAGRPSRPLLLTSPPPAARETTARSQEHVSFNCSKDDM